MWSIWKRNQITNRISRLGDFCRNGTISSSKKGRRDFSDFSKCNGCQFQFKGFEKVTGEIYFHNSSTFSSKTSDWFPTADTNIDLQKIYDLRICDYSGPAGQRGAVMVDNQNENLQWKIFLNSTPRPNQVFRCIEEELGYFVSKNYHGVLMVFSGETVLDT